MLTSSVCMHNAGLHQHSIQSRCVTSCGYVCSSVLQWEPLVLAIGLCESYRVACGWATPTGEGFNSLKDEYEMGNLG